MQVFLWILVAVIGYALGNLNGALLISKMMMHDDVRSHGSGNAGLTNFFRTYGGIQSVLVIVIDMGKCMLACYLAVLLLPEYALTAKALAGAATVLGHSYPAVSGFRGGKGILSGSAVALMIDWRIYVIIMIIFGITVALTKYVSLGSILATSAFGVCMLIGYWGHWPALVLTVGTAIFVIARHHKNIGRLLHGTESKLTFHKKQ